MSTLTFWNTYFLESEIWEGDIPRDDTRQDKYTGLTVDEAVRLIKGDGLTFTATGTDWAADPDGFRTLNYRDGRSVEVTATLDGWSDDELADIIEQVG